MYFYRKTSALLAFFVATFLWKFELASAIVCYDCNSEYDPRCGEHFDPYTLGTVNCSLRDPPEGVTEEATLCRSIKIEALGKTRYVRGCGYLRSDQDNGCKRTSGTHELFTTYCSCSEDLCNAVGKSGVGVLAIVAAAIVCLL